MSKLLDMLEKASQPSATPMGFGAAARKEAGPPSLILVGRISQGDLAKKKSISGAEVDAVLVASDSVADKALDAISAALGDRLWGVESAAVGRKEAEKLKEKGCDFLVFDPEKTEAAVLNDEDIAKVMPVGPEVDEDMGRAISVLPIDCAIYSPGEDLLPLTIKRLIEVQMARGLVGKPFLMTAPSELEAADLEALRSAGVIGFVVDLAAADAIAKTREAIAGLPKRRSKDGYGEIMARVPVGFVPASPPSEPDEEDDEDDG